MNSRLFYLLCLLSLSIYSWGKDGKLNSPGNMPISLQNGNLSNIAKVKASSCVGEHIAGKATDGNLSSYWKSANSTGWLMFDLGECYSLNNICQVFNETSVWKFKVEGSTDGKNWLMLLNRTKGIAGDIFSASVSGTYRYVRLTVLESADGFLPTSVEFRMNGTKNRRNIGLGRQPMDVLHRENHTSKDALDGNMSTYWLAPSNTFPQSMTVDLGKPCILLGVQQIFKDYDEWKYLIEGSDDELHWKILVDHSLGVSGFDFKSPIDACCRYVRLTVLGSSKGHRANSCEFRLWSEEPNDQYAELAFDAVSSTSSFYNNEHSQEKAFDGDKATFWYADADTFPQWLCADLGTPCDIREIEQTFAESDIWSFVIEGSNDKKTWEMLSDHRNGMAGVVCSNNVKGIYRYVRMTVLGAENRSRASSRSFAIKGFGSPNNATWWEETSGMTRYYPKYYNQSLRSIIDSLDILQAQGYRNIELSAIYEGDPTVWTGLGATNNYAIDPSIGSMNDFEELIREMHARDMKLTFFGNVGYCWYKAPFFEKACDDQRKGIDSKERNWFHFSDKKLNEKWFWSDRAQAYYYSFWGNSDGAEGRIPSYNFNNEEWQLECENYLNFWADKGVDGLLLDAPEVYDGITDEIISQSIIKILNRRGILTNAEGSSDIDKWIGKLGFRLIQGFDLYGWGGNKKSEVLYAHRSQNPKALNGLLENYRDKATALGATTITPPMWEIPATREERLFEVAYLISTGTLFINHYGDHHNDYIAQFILKNWPMTDQEKFYNLIRLQNSFVGLAPMGQRTCIPSNDDTKYMVFKRSNKDGKVSALIVMNFQDTEETISFNLKNSGILLGQKPLNLLDKMKDMPILTEKYQVVLPAYGYLLLGVSSDI